MHIFLTILSIIGIVLLVILGIVLLVILLVLFAPFRYSIRAVKQSDIAGYAKVGWIFSFIKATVSFENKKLDWDLKLGPLSLKKVFLDKKKPKPKKPESEVLAQLGPAIEIDMPDEGKKKKKKTSEPAKVDEKPIVKKEEIPKKAEEEKSAVPDMPVVKAETKEIKTDTSAKPEEKPEIKPAPKETVFVKPVDESVIKEAKAAADYEKQVKLGKAPKIEKSFAEEPKKNKFIEKIKSIYENIREKVLLIIKIKNAFNAVKGYLFKIIKHIVPKKLKGYLTYGFDDPSLTGKSVAVLSMIYTKLPKHFKFDPRFDESIIECDAELQGRIYLIVLAVNAIKIYFNKEVKVAMGRVKGGKK